MATTAHLGRALVSAMVQNDADAMRAIVHPDIHWHLPASVSRGGFEPFVVGAEKLISTVGKAMKTVYRELSVEFEHVLVSGDFVTVLCTLKGSTHQGRDYENRYAYILRFDGARLVEGWELTDTATIFAAAAREAGGRS